MKPSYAESAAITIAHSALFWIAFVVLLLASGFLSSSFLLPDLSKPGYGIFGSLSALLLTWIFISIRRESFSDIGLIWESKTLLRFLTGLGIGLIIFALIVHQKAVISN